MKGIVERKEGKGKEDIGNEGLGEGRRLLV